MKIYTANAGQMITPVEHESKTMTPGLFVYVWFMLGVLVTYARWLFVLILLYFMPNSEGVIDRITPKQIQWCYLLTGK